MFVNVQIDDHYCSDNADNAHQEIRKHHEIGHEEYRDIVFQFPISMHQLGFTGPQYVELWRLMEPFNLKDASSLHTILYGNPISSAHFARYHSQITFQNKLPLFQTKLISCHAVIN